MAITVEDGTGLAEANAYISVADADSYHAARGRSDWQEHLSGAKESAIVRATDYLDSVYRRRFVGTRGSSTQSLEWPRSGVCDENGSVIANVPTDIANATAELARAMLSVDLAPLPSDTPEGAVVMKREKLGPIEEETQYVNGYSPAKVKGYPFVTAMLGRWIVPDGMLLRV